MDQDATTDTTIRATLELKPGEPLRGSLTREGGERREPFTGWLELASALEALRRPADAGPFLPRERDQEQTEQAGSN